MQNKLSFHQTSVSLEIIGLPDYSNNENKDQISIISQWKLTYSIVFVFKMLIALYSGFISSFFSIFSKGL